DLARTNLQGAESTVAARFNCVQSTARCTTCHGRARPPGAPSSSPSQKICGRLGDPSLPLKMDRNVAIIGAGVSGLTCGVVLAEQGYRTAIFAKEPGRQTPSGAHAAIWFPSIFGPAVVEVPLRLYTHQLYF